MNRIKSVDTFRLAAILAVIIIHTMPFRGDYFSANEYYKYIAVMMDQISRFAVPFFFIISGYFWGIKIKSGSSPTHLTIKMAQRIAIIFAVWSIIYLIPFNYIVYERDTANIIDKILLKLNNIIQHPSQLIMQGTKAHLWFLPSLIIAALVAAVFVHIKQTKLLIAISVTLYIFGVLAKSYANTPIGIPIQFNTRNGPFFSTLLFVSGYLLASTSTSSKWFFYGLILFISGSILHFLEIYFLWSYFDTNPIQDYVIGTYFMGMGAAIMALSDHPALTFGRLGEIGRLTLGIYAVHFVFVDIFRPAIADLGSSLWELGYIGLVFVSSISISLLLSKNKVTKTIVA